MGVGPGIHLALAAIAVSRASDSGCQTPAPSAGEEPLFEWSIATSGTITTDITSVDRSDLTYQVEFTLTDGVSTSTWSSTSRTPTTLEAWTTTVAIPSLAADAATLQARLVVTTADGTEIDSENAPTLIIWSGHDGSVRRAIPASDLGSESLRGPLTDVDAPGPYTDDDGATVIVTTVSPAGH